ncbi:glycoside hydrolase family 97 N-terminal domain-containing protein, partial [Bacteroides cellulosilyticus]
MTSPDGKYQFTLSDSGGQLHFSLTWNGKQTVKPSLLGINANVEWRDGVEIGTVDIAMTEEQELGDMRARFFAI